MKKLLVVALSVALLLSTTACGTNSELEALKQENEQLKSQLTDTEEKTTEKPTEKPAEKSQEQKTSDTQPNSGNAYEFTAGNYDCPADIPAGKYDVVATSGYGVFSIKSTDGYSGMSEIMDTEDENYISEYKNAKIEDGYSVGISGNLKIQLIPKN